MKNLPPAQLAGQEESLEPQNTEFTTPQTQGKGKSWNNGKNRILILWQLAEKWASMGYYQNSPTRAMAALLGVIG